MRNLRIDWNDLIKKLFGLAFLVHLLFFLREISLFSAAPRLVYVAPTAEPQSFRRDIIILN